jgi:hypothetical protein
MHNPIVEQLKSLKHERAGGSPDAQWLVSTKETLMMQIGNTVGGSEPRTGFRALAESLRIFFPENLAKAMAIPMAVLLLLVGTSLGSTAVVAAAHDTLPGHPLYNVKLAAESLNLRFAGKSDRTERRVEIAGRRLNEMARLASSVDYDKEGKIERVAALFSDEMNAIRKDLSDLQDEKDADEAIRIALRVEAKSDEYQAIFKHGLSVGRPSFRMALLNLDQVSVKALEILVEKQSLASDVLPEAQLSSAVGRKIDTFAAHVATTQDGLVGGAASPSQLLTVKAQEAVDEAKELLSQGDFRAAVKKVSEGADLVTEAENADKNPPAEPEESATGTEEVPDASASSTEPAATQPQ